MKRLAACTIGFLAVLIAGCVPTVSNVAPVIQVVRNAAKADSLQDQTDVYVAETYPDFRVSQTKVLLDFENTGQPGIWYVLERKSKPGFVMAVLVMKPDPIDQRISALRLERDVDFFTTDGAFRRLKGSKDSLSPADLDKISDLYIQQKPSKNALIVATQGEPDFVDLYVVPDPPQTKDGQFHYTMSPTLIGAAMAEYPEDLEDLSPPTWSLKFEDLPAP